MDDDMETKNGQKLNAVDAFANDHQKNLHNYATWQNKQDEEIYNGMFL